MLMESLGRRGRHGGHVYAGGPFLAAFCAEGIEEQRSKQGEGRGESEATREDGSGRGLIPSPTYRAAVASCGRWRRAVHGGGDTEEVGGEGGLGRPLLHGPVNR